MPGLIQLPPLNKEDHPGTKFWEASAWEEWVKSQKEKGGFSSHVPGQGTNSSWMEDESGNPIPERRRQAIHREARQMWADMRHYKIEPMPFGAMPSSVVEFFCVKIAFKFSEFRLCADDWKADRLWMENFLSAGQPDRRARKAANKGADERGNGELQKMPPPQQEPGSTEVSTFRWFHESAFLC